MANNRRISELDDLTEAAADDYLPIVDKSDTTQSAEGSTKKITVANLLAALNALLEEGE